MTLAPSAADFAALRAVLGGPPAPSVRPARLAAAAREGQVVRVAARRAPEIAELLAEDAMRAVGLDLALEQATRTLRALFEGAGIAKLALLKGSATAHYLYEDPSERQRKDVDLLVAEAEFPAAEAALIDAGWERIDPGTWWSESPSHRHESTFRRGFSGVSLECDLHRRLTAWRAFAVDHAGILERARPRGGSVLPACHPRDALLHGALHAATTGYGVPLRSWLDIARLCGHPEVALEQVARDARGAGLGRALWAALRVAQRWLSAQVPEAILEGLRPPRLVARALDRLLSGQGATPVAAGPLPAAWSRQLARALALAGPREAPRLAAQYADAAARAIRARID